jgi:hypothetical protein
METSSLHELIARTGKLAYHAGIDSEQERAIKILRALPKEFNHNDYVLRAVAKAIAQLKEERK